MKTLKYHYHLKIQFEQPVTQHCFTVRCSPQADERQMPLKQNISILPKEFLCENRDSFGNAYFFGRAQNPHSLFEVVSDGMIRTGLSEGVSAGEPCRLGMFAPQTDYTRPGEGLCAFFQSLDLKKASGNVEKGLYLMEHLRANFSYEQGKTDISTTAEQAWQLGCGVCQDYSHILLSLCRMAGMQARYAAGMLIGEGLSHAWVEIAENERWFGLDATNGVRVLEDHIKISHGRDYADCLLNQGVFTGITKQIQTVSVNVEEVIGNI